MKEIANMIGVSIPLSVECSRPFKGNYPLKSTNIPISVISEVGDMDILIDNSHLLGFLWIIPKISGQCIMHRY